MWAEFLHVITDPAHLVAEFVFEGAFFVAGVLWVKRHDRNHHRGKED